MSYAKNLDKDQLLLIKKLLIKSADIASPARPLPQCKEWALRISTEFFAQVSDNFYLKKLRTCFNE